MYQNPNTNIVGTEAEQSLASTGQFASGETVPQYEQLTQSELTNYGQQVPGKQVAGAIPQQSAQYAQSFPSQQGQAADVQQAEKGSDVTGTERTMQGRQTKQRQQAAQQAPAGQRTTQQRPARQRFGQPAQRQPSQQQPVQRPVQQQPAQRQPIQRPVQQQPTQRQPMQQPVQQQPVRRPVEGGFASGVRNQQALVGQRGAPGQQGPVGAGFQQAPQRRQETFPQFQQEAAVRDQFGTQPVGRSGGGIAAGSQVPLQQQGVGASIGGIQRAAGRTSLDEPVQLQSGEVTTIGALLAGAGIDPSLVAQQTNAGAGTRQARSGFVAQGSQQPVNQQGTRQVQS